ncbi:MAG: RsmB/NOP family class I SAM-dependent RNA methyltransferase [Pseudomonadota bacterium]
MRPAARIASAIDILARLEAEDRPADGLIRGVFRANRYIGAKDRRAIGDLVYGVLRHSARLDWWLSRAQVGAGGARGRVLAELTLAQGLGGAEIASLFDGDTYHPPPLESAERALLEQLDGAELDHTEQPDWVRLEVPEWLLPGLREALGDDQEILALGHTAPLDLRVNLLKAERAAVRQALAEEGIESAPTPFSPWGLRVTARHALPALKAFRDGLFEVQDEGSQLVALLSDARPGLSVADLCAGAGGKALALAMTQGGEGRLVALDLDARRLERAGPRLARAGVDFVETRVLVDGDPWLDQEAGSFDRVLVDAPCSGSGAWRRQPDARWRLTAARLEQYTQSQAEILRIAAGLLRPGGRLIYATCSLLPPENRDQATTFLTERPDYRALPLGDLWREQLETPYPGDECPALLLTPLRHGTDGFYLAVFQRKVGP